MTPKADSATTNDALLSERDALRAALKMMSGHAEQQELLMPLHEQRQVTVALQWGLGGMCGYCQRQVANPDPDHLVTPIVEGGRGVECRLRGDIL